MQFVSAVSDHENPEEALNQLLKQVRRQLKGNSAHLALWFASSAYEADWPQLHQRLLEQLDYPVLLGCSAGGVIGDGQELEEGPGMSLVAASLPGVDLKPFVLSSEGEELNDDEEAVWSEITGVTPEDEPVFILLPDPFTCYADELVAGLNEMFPGCPVIGGMVSGAGKPGEHWLVCNDEFFTEGAVGVAMVGNIQMDTIVSQGCRPIGESYIVTRAEEQVIHEIGSHRAIDVLQEIFEKLPPDDQDLARSSLVMGVAADEHVYPLKRGDFLIRNLVGADMDAGSISVAGYIDVGQTVQFHLRDARAAEEDLREWLEGMARKPASLPAGGLLFNCVGRGRQFFGASNHDVQLIQRSIHHLPVGGFFSNGEIGPIAGVNHLHGYTASLGLFRPKYARKKSAARKPKAS